MIDCEFVNNIEKVFDVRGYKLCDSDILSSLSDDMESLLEIFPKARFYNFRCKILFVLDRRFPFGTFGTFSDFSEIFERIMFLRLDKDFLATKLAFNLKYYEYEYLHRQISLSDYREGFIRLYNISGLKYGEYIECSGFLKNYRPFIYLSSEFTLYKEWKGAAAPFKFSEISF